MSESAAGTGVPVSLRRVVTGRSGDGVESVRIDGAAPICSAYRHIPGMVTRLLWATGDTGGLDEAAAETTGGDCLHVPPAGGTRLIVATFPPDSVFADPGFDGAAAAEENGRLSPGLAELFDETGFHRTDTIDYGIVLDGELVLELEDGSRTHLARHDVVVQHGTRHAWRNPTDRPATIAFVLIGARRQG